MHIEVLHDAVTADTGVVRARQNIIAVLSEAAWADAAGQICIFRDWIQIARVFRCSELKHNRVARNVDTHITALAAHMVVVPFVTKRVEELAYVLRVARGARVSRAAALNAGSLIRTHGHVGIAVRAGVIVLLAEARKFVFLQLAVR